MASVNLISGENNDGRAAAGSERRRRKTARAARRNGKYHGKAKARLKEGDAHKGGNKIANWRKEENTPRRRLGMRACRNGAAGVREAKAKSGGMKRTRHRNWRRRKIMRAWRAKAARHQTAHGRASPARWPSQLVGWLALPLYGGARRGGSIGVSCSCMKLSMYRQSRPST